MRPARGYPAQPHHVGAELRGLPGPERDKLAGLRRENKQLRLERDILSSSGNLAPQAVAEHGLDLAPVTIHQRIAFSHAPIGGQVVMEVDPRGKAAAEAIVLYQGVAKELEKVKKCFHENKER